MAAPTNVTVLHGHSTDGKTKTTWHVAAFLDVAKARQAAATLKLLNKIGEHVALKSHDPGAFVPDTDTVRPNVTYSASTVAYNPTVTFAGEDDPLAG